ncbi:ASCH domain-containing protein OS=Bosea thiooxidans OX=53254 GN=SAMN05660750_03292 PE=4 SV=1 [Bosea thiooxidans]|uniref:ASCH domain-containing protein n=1 Tax=Bosea thiooxidans TaxID=53254 RepID=A0A1T5FK81_9HYPH|nr:hypothetical protein [Bosea thiooxidans]SKB96580.1 hypothetical protein SAMN05660750_03292 [Bosea thiooxidans]
MGERAHTPGRGRPILFSAPMVRALLAGTKTQTRRVFVPPAPYAPTDDISVGVAVGSIAPKIKVGDRLWVREAWRTTGCDGRSDYLPPRDLQPHPAWYEANGTAPAGELVGKLRPSMFMPRWASRLTLTVTDARVQRLQDISEEDAEAEGYPSKEQRATSGVAEIRDAYPIAWYSWLWEQINGVGSWEANPWVAAYSFTVERRNIDAPATAAKTGGE